MKITFRLWVLLVCAFLTGCAGKTLPSAPPPPPGGATSNDTMRAGDKITITLAGVPDGGFNILVQIPTSGTVTVPYLTRTFMAAGANAADLANSISNAYKADKIYTNPHVSVFPETRFVNISGDVRSPSRVPYTSDLTLMTTIISCGGFSEYADRHHVRISRGDKIFEVDCVALQRNPGTDPPVYPGDQIFVPRTPF